MIPTKNHAADKVQLFLFVSDVSDGAGVDEVCLALQLPVLADKLVLFFSLSVPRKGLHITQYSAF